MASLAAPAVSNRWASVALIVAKRLRDARTGAGLSVAALARELGISRPFLAAVEAGRKPFPEARLEQLRKALPSLFPAAKPAGSPKVASLGATFTAEQVVEDEIRILHKRMLSAPDPEKHKIGAVLTTTARLLDRMRRGEMTEAQLVKTTAWAALWGRILGALEKHPAAAKDVLAALEST